MDILAIIVTIVLLCFIVFVLVFYVLMLFGFVYGAPFVPTSSKRVKNMIELAKPKPGEVWIDIGSGDGRVMIAAAKAGARAIGYEIHPYLVALTKIKIWLNGLKGKAEVKMVNFWPINLSEADIVSVYLLPEKMDRLQRKLEDELKPGCRIVSNAFNFPGWTPVAEMDRVKLYRKQ